MSEIDDIREALSYNPETGNLHWLVKRNGHNGGVRPGDVAGTEGHSHGYIQVGVKGKRYYAHRVAWLLTYGAWPPEQIDHVNGNPKDNRLANLRAASSAQNSRNQNKVRVQSLTGLKGVHFDKKCRKWRPYIKVNGKTRWLGQFATPEEAVDARRSAAKKYYGEFAPSGAR